MLLHHAPDHRIDSARTKPVLLGRLSGRFGDDGKFACVSPTGPTHQ